MDGRPPDTRAAACVCRRDRSNSPVRSGTGAPIRGQNTPTVEHLRSRLTISGGSGALVKQHPAAGWARLPAGCRQVRPSSVPEHWTTRRLLGRPYRTDSPSIGRELGVMPKAISRGNPGHLPLSPMSGRRGADRHRLRTTNHAAARQGRSTRRYATVVRKTHGRHAGPVNYPSPSIPF